MRYESINSDLFSLNRRNFVKHMKPNSLAVFTSNHILTRSADAAYKWRQNPDLFYLSGIDQEETFLVLFPDAPEAKHREVLFVRRTNEHIMWWEGKKHTLDEARGISGIETVTWSDNFEGMLCLFMNHAENVYLNTNEHDRSINMGETHEAKFARDLMGKYPLHKFERSAPIMLVTGSMSAAEVELLKKAIDITHKGFLRALGFIKPGVWEFEVEAELAAEYIRNRGTGHAYEPIIATGVNACAVFTYMADAQCKAGDLLLMDAASEYANYNADLPHNCLLALNLQAPKNVYNAVLRACTTKPKPWCAAALRLPDLNNEVGKVMESELLSLRLLNKTDIKNQR